MTMASGNWFIIKSGKYEGHPHLVGWTLTAILTTPTGTNDDGWLGLAICPRCGALVRNNDADDTVSRDMWQHEQWHAATDHPIPSELQLELTQETA